MNTLEGQTSRWPLSQHGKILLVDDLTSKRCWYLISVMFRLSGRLSAVRWQIQGLEETSQEEVSERGQPDSCAVVSGHHLLTLARLQHGVRPIRHTCTVYPARWAAILWIRGSVWNTHTYMHSHNLALFQVCLHPLRSLYIEEVPLAACTEPNNRSWTKLRCLSKRCWTVDSRRKEGGTENTAGKMRDCVKFGKGR